MQPRFVILIKRLLIIGIVGYAGLILLRWLLMWGIVSASYCYHRDRLKEYKVACGFPLYPKWEYQSLRHADEFWEPIQQSVEDGGFNDLPVKIKVMQYQQEKALVWYLGESGSRWLALFQRHPQTGAWIMEGYDIIRSTMGGSADSFYWY